MAQTALQTALKEEGTEALAPGSRRTIRVYVDNCEERIHPLYIFLRSWFKRTGAFCDVVFLDNGSTDGSSERIAELCKKDSSVRTVRLDGKRGRRDALRVFAQLGHGICDVDASVASAWHDVVSRVVLRPCA